MQASRVLGSIALAVMLSAAANAVGAQVADTPAAKLSIDRLYSLPWVIGTTPQAPQWSPDSRQLAFLWNDDGSNFRDVWLVNATGGKPMRVTNLPRPLSPVDPGKDFDKLTQTERAETDRGVTAVTWAPDGRHLIFNVHGQLCRVLPGHAPERLLKSDSTVEDFAISPPADQVAFVRAGALWSATLTGQPVERTLYLPGHTDASVESFVWSGDGLRIAFVEADTSHVRERGIPQYLDSETRLVPVKRAFPGEPSASRRIGIVTVSSGTIQWVAWTNDPLDEIFGLAWSPDSRTLLVDKSDLYIKDRRLLLFDAEHSQTRELLREMDPSNVTAEWWSGWSPDGSGVFFISDRDNDYHVYFEPLSGGEPKPVTRGNWAVFAAWVSPRANSLFVVSNQGNPEERQVYRVPLKGGVAQLITATHGTHKPLPSPNGKWLADIFSNDTTPPDLYLQSSDPEKAGSAAPLQMTHSPLPDYRNYPWLAAKYVTFTNATDGTALQARLTLPKNFDPSKHYPAILGSVYSNTVHNEWGGRIFHPTWAIDQFLAQQGYVIMNVDISGSSGHGKLFRQRIREDYGGVDVEDLASGVKYLVSQGYVDPRRVGIWGSSYGGLLTTTSLFSKPGLYRAGVAGAPATSLFHAQTGEMRTMMAPQDHRAQYERSSAFLKSSGLQDHLLIIHGMRDDTVLFKDSVVLQQRLILQGGDVDFVMLPNAPHGWDTEGLAQTRFAFHKLFDYFERYLKDPAP